MNNLNYKTTKQRSLILNKLEVLKNHPTAEELYANIKKECRNISLSTVYRNLENFYENGLINKINTIPARYDARKDIHHHARCINCGKIFDFDVNINLDFNSMKENQFKIHNYKLEVNCTCNKCINK